MWVLVAALLLLVGLGAGVPATLAHGGGTPQLTGVKAGPFQVFAWSSPDPVRVGTMHVTVALAEPTDQTPVLDADVAIELVPVAVEGVVEAVVARATHADAVNKVTYEADIEVPAAGQWQVTVDYSTKEGTGRTGFDLTVQRQARVNWLLVGGAGLGITLVGWMVWPGRGRANGK
jgi:hypothetical protein